PLHDARPTVSSLGRGGRRDTARADRRDTTAAPSPPRSIAMLNPRIAAAATVVLVALLAGCAGLVGREPVEVIAAGIEPIDGQGTEARMRAKLRVHNPNDQPLGYNRVFVRADVDCPRLAT